MFVLESSPRFTHPVEVSVPTDGGHKKQTFKATFVVLGTTDTAAFDLASAADTTKLLQKVLVGFSEVDNAEGQPLEFCDESRDALIDMPFVRTGLVKSYFGGVSKAQLGN